jgi:hypothetical protein
MPLGPTQRINQLTGTHLLRRQKVKSHSILVLVIIILCAGTPVDARYSGGTGEPNDPYQIATPEDLNDIGDHQEDWDKNFILINDVNLAQYTGTQFKIIGRYIKWNDPNNKPFTGIFDGNNHKVWNFTWSSTGRNYIGLFGCVGQPGQLKNLGMENVDVNAVNGDCVGGLVGRNYGGVISNCHSTGSVIGTYSVGGLVGFNDGTINNCYSTGNVSGGYYVGGLVGENGGTINNCYSTGNVSGGQYVGGLVGFNDGTINNCYSTGNVSGGQHVGGLVGRNYGGVISNCYSTGSVTGPNYVGGLVGFNLRGTITDCYSTGSVTGDYWIGGLVGSNGMYYGGGNGDEGGYITNCYSTGSVSGDGCVGGLVGFHFTCEITNCYSTGNVSASWGVGGLVGWIFEGYVISCYSTGRVSGNENVGGLVGRNGYCDVLFGCVEGTIAASFWDNQTSGEPNSAGGIPKTTAEMKTKSTFTDAGWDFVNVWDICEGTNYPRLQWQIPNGDFLCPYGVDFMDFAVISSAWLSKLGEPDWNPACDISNPKDSVIDELDLVVFCENWLKGM